ELKRAGLWEIDDGYGFWLGIGGFPQSSVTVLKLHGSTNWLDVPFAGARGFFQSNGPPLGERPLIRGPLEFEYLGYASGISDPRWPASPSFAGVPAYILPVLHKKFFQLTSYGKERDDFWDSLWDQAIHAVQSTERLVVIGYSFPKADERARNMIFKEASQEAQISIYCGGSSNSICEEFRAL